MQDRVRLRRPRGTAATDSIRAAARTAFAASFLQRSERVMKDRAIVRCESVDTRPNNGSSPGRADPAGSMAITIRMQAQIEAVDTNAAVAPVKNNKNLERKCLPVRIRCVAGTHSIP